MPPGTGLATVMSARASVSRARLLTRTKIRRSRKPRGLPNSRACGRRRSAFELDDERAEPTLRHCRLAAQFARKTTARLARAPEIKETDSEGKALARLSISRRPRHVLIAPPSRREGVTRLWDLGDEVGAEPTRNRGVLDHDRSTDRTEAGATARQRRDRCCPRMRVRARSTSTDRPRTPDTACIGADRLPGRACVVGAQSGSSGCRIGRHSYCPIASSVQ
jgi:hypothetical protein